MPLESYETAIKYISSTETRTGMKVKAVLNSKNYETGETVTDEEIDMLRIRLHKTLSEELHDQTPDLTIRDVKLFLRSP